jgi:hypothetical protein
MINVAFVEQDGGDALHDPIHKILRDGNPA